jgi:hypothetical protein
VPVWPSAFPAVVTSLLPLLSETVNIRIEQSGVAGTAFTSPPITTSRYVEGDVSLDATYNGLEFFLTAALGFMAPSIEGVPMPELLDTGIYRHLIEMDPVLNSQTWLADEGWLANSGLIANQRKLRRGSYVIDKEVAIWEAKSCMLNSLILQTNPVATTFTSGLVGYDMTFSTVVGNNLSALFCPKDSLDFRDAILYLSDTAPLTSASIVSDLVGFAVSLNNNLQLFNTQKTGKFVDEPARQGPAIVTGSFAIPFFNGAGGQLQAWATSGTRLMGLLEFIGEDLGDFDASMKFWFPDIRLTGSQIEVSGPEQVQQNYSFVASSSETPEGFPANIKNGPMVIEIVNNTSAHALL